MLRTALTITCCTVCFRYHITCVSSLILPRIIHPTVTAHWLFEFYSIQTRPDHRSYSCTVHLSHTFLSIFCVCVCVCVCVCDCEGSLQVVQCMYGNTPDTDLELIVAIISRKSILVINLMHHHYHLHQNAVHHPCSDDDHHNIEHKDLRISFFSLLLLRYPIDNFDLLHCHCHFLLLLLYM